MTVAMIDKSIEDEYVEIASMLGDGRDAALKALGKAADPKEELRKLKARYKRQTAGVALRARRKELDGWTAEARERHEQRQRREASERQRQRRDMSLGQRLDKVMGDFELLSLVKAAAVQPAIGHSKPESRAPRVEESPALTFERRLRLLVESAEATFDREKGYVIDGKALESAEAKDTRILADWIGVLPEEIAFLDSTLGTAAYIAGLREKNGLRARDGRPRPPKDEDE